jgi:antirestriction protein ArdC
LGVKIPGSSEALYNLDQTNRAYVPSPRPKENPDSVFAGIVSGLGVKIEHGFDATCKYLGAEDKIRIPHKWMFDIGPGGPSGYYDALGHELMHASEPRLKWEGHPDIGELRAEIGGSGFLCSLLGVPPLPLRLRRHHDVHVLKWIRLMKGDPQLLVRVCDAATDGVAFLVRFAGKEIKWHLSGT